MQESRLSEARSRLVRFRYMNTDLAGNAGVKCVTERMVIPSKSTQTVKKSKEPTKVRFPKQLTQFAK